MLKRTSRRRAGFTLVELMVSAAVCVIIMAVLSTVFQTGIDTMRDMRSIGTLQDQLRAATEMIRHDLQADHFVPRDRDPSTHKLLSGPRLSDQWLNEPTWQPPIGGFFHIESDGSWVTEKHDGDNFNFTQSVNSPNFLLHFTSVLAGDKPQNMFSAEVGTPPTSTALTSPVAEIAYFVDTSIPTNHRLVRRQRLVAKTDLDRATFQSKDTAGEVIAGDASNVWTFGNIAQHRIPYSTAPNAPRTTPQPAMLSNSRTGDDILLSNVKLFEIKANWEGGSQLPRPFSTSPAGNSDAPFDFLSQSGSSTFDTGDGLTVDTAKPGGNNAAQRIRIKALQIRLRIYDPQMQTTRQVTIVQDM